MPKGQTVQANAAAVHDVIASAVAAVPSVRLRVVDLASTGDAGFVTQDGRTAFAVIEAPVAQTLGPYIEAQLDPALAKSAAAHGFSSGLTGYGLLAATATTAVAQASIVEVLLAAAAALVVLLFVFGSFLALLPLLIAAVSILTTFLLVLLLTTFTDVSIIVEFLIALIGLGVALDYSLLVVSRWREERAHGRSNEDAVLVAMSTAGRSRRRVRRHRRDQPARPARRPGAGPAQRRARRPADRPGQRLGRRDAAAGVAVEHRPAGRLPAAAARGHGFPWLDRLGRRRLSGTASSRPSVAAVVLGLMVIPVFGLKIGQTGVASLASSGPRYEALQTLVDGGVGNGVLTPIEVLVPAPRPAQPRQRRRVPGVQMAVVGATAGGSSVVDVVPSTATVDSSSRALVDKVRSTVQRATGSAVGVTGVGPASRTTCGPSTTGCPTSSASSL